VFDDVTDGSWDGLVEVFGEALQRHRFSELGRDGRVGILEARTGSAEVASG